MQSGPSGLSRCEGSVADMGEEFFGPSDSTRPVYFHYPFSKLCLVNSHFISWDSETRVHPCACYGFGGSML